MFEFVEGVAADGRAGGAVTAGEADAVGGVFFEPVDDVAPCAHVEGFFLTPDPFLSGLGVAGHDLGEEVLEVPAGRFATRHIRIDCPGVDDFEVWAGGEDCLPVQLRSKNLRQTYVLVELQGDWR